MDELKKHKHTYSIRFTVGTMFIIATIVTSLFAISLQYMFTRQMSEEHVVSKLTKATTDVSEYIQEVDLNAKSSARILSSISKTIDHDFSEQEIRTILVQVLKDNPLFYSIYFGNEREEFYQIINLESSPIVRQRIEAEPNDRWVVIKINGPEHNRIRQTIYYTAEFEQTGVRTKRSNYFPSQRPWFQASSDKVYKTEPYLFKHLKITGQTYSLKTREAVLGIDIVLSSISSRITASAMGLAEGQGVESFVFHRTGEIIASNQQGGDEIQSVTKPLALSSSEQELVSNTPSLLVSNQLNWRPYDYARAGEPQGYAIALLELIAKKTGLHFEFINGFSSDELIRKLGENQLDLAHSLPELDPSVDQRQLLIFKEPLALASLTQDAPNWYESEIGVVDGHRFNTSSIMGELKPMIFSDGRDAYQALMKGEIQALLDTRRTLEHLVQSSSIPLKIHPLPIQAAAPFYLTINAKHQKIEPLLRRALDSITPEEQTQLSEAWFSEVKEDRIPYDGLEELAGTNTIHKREVNGDTKYFYVEALGQNAQSNEEFLAVIVPESVVMSQVYQRLYTSIGGTVIVLCLLLPVAWVFGNPIVKPIRQLQKETKKIKCRNFDDVQIVDTNIKEVWALSHSIHDMAREIKRHEKQQEIFVESFIKLIAQAIDDKSPYTAGHCNRVPEIGMLLADAAEKCKTGSLNDFSFANSQERREFRIAAWLHDCGKITTPEHIVDKGTKLEANYNRIHEIRMRFEVLWRDAEIEFLQSQLSGQDREEGLRTLRDKKAQLQDDFAFVANSNVGGEFMGNEQAERIQSIGKQTWQRNFDDRLGLSPFEELKKTQLKRTLPTTEALLSDKPEHIQHRVRPLEFDPAFGIKMEVPKYQYNLGEIYNLSISRGTLTAEDRFKINEHMISGIKMLEALPFPPELRNVPRYASTHHETLKGTGYPRKLTGAELSVPERILVIADIFEALTAADRPYKKAKPVSVAVDILYKMALDEHVDMELFLLFLESGVYLEYAKKFLPESQVDQVDISQYLESERVA